MSQKVPLASANSDPGANAQGDPAPPVDPLVAAFDRLCIESPERLLVLSPDGPATAAQIDRLARALAAGFLGEASPGEVLGLAVANGPAFLAGLVALLRRGCTPLLLDSQEPRESLPGVVAKFGGRRALCSREQSGGWQLLEVGSSNSGPRSGESWSGGVIKLSSGSSGEPRGVATPCAALLADDRALTHTMQIQAGDRLLAMVPFSHSYGLSSLVVPALVRGSTLVVPAGSSPFSALDAADEFGATVMPTVPSFLKALVQLEARLTMPKSVRLVISAGAPLEPDVACAFESIYGRSVHVFYGTSETGGITYDRSGGAARRGSLGTPVDGVDVRLEPVKELGELRRVVVRSMAVADRYLPHHDSDLSHGEFRTSDLAEWIDGELRLLGRMGRLINIRGKKVHPREVEGVIKQLLEVDEAVVRKIRDAEALVAIVAVRDGATLTGSEIVGWCRRRLAPYKIPRRVLLVERIPRTARGKIDRAAVDELVAAAGSVARNVG